MLNDTVKINIYRSVERVLLDDSDLIQEIHSTVSFPVGDGPFLSPLSRFAFISHGKNKDFEEIYFLTVSLKLFYTT